MSNHATRTLTAAEEFPGEDMSWFNDPEPEPEPALDDVEPEPKPKAKRIPKTNGTGGFFAVDLLSFNKVALLGTNSAIAYLVLARGTGGDQRTTSWSTHAIETRTGISRPKAKAAIQGLVDAGFVRKLRDGKRPGYRIELHSDVAGYESRWVWLPNELVDLGTGEGFGAFSPIERLRKSMQDGAVRLLVNLYDAQTLADDGGINWRPDAGIFQLYDREQLSSVGELVVWGFTAGDLYSWGKSSDLTKPYVLADRVESDFWPCLKVIVKAGLLEFIPHLVDSETPDAEIIHALTQDGCTGLQHERETGRLALEAAQTLLSECHTARVAENGPDILAPVPLTSPKVAMVGIGRLLHRPLTSVTLKWWSDSMKRSEAAQTAYAGYIRRIARPALRLVA